MIKNFIHLLFGERRANAFGMKVTACAVRPIVHTHGSRGGWSMSDRNVFLRVPSVPSFQLGLKFVSASNCDVFDFSMPSLLETEKGEGVPLNVVEQTCSEIFPLPLRSRCVRQKYPAGIEKRLRSIKPENVFCAFQARCLPAMSLFQQKVQHNRTLVDALLTKCVLLDTKAVLFEKAKWDPSFTHFAHFSRCVRRTCQMSPGCSFTICQSWQIMETFRTHAQKAVHMFLASGHFIMATWVIPQVAQCKSEQQSPRIFNDEEMVFVPDKFLWQLKSAC